MKKLFLLALLFSSSAFSSEVNTSVDGYSFDTDKLVKGAEKKIIKKKVGEAIVYYKSAAIFGNPEAKFMYSNFLSMGYGRPPYYKDSMPSELLRESCDLGYKESCEQIKTKKNIIFQLKYNFLLGDESTREYLVNIYTNGMGEVKPSKEELNKYIKINDTNK